MTIKETYFTKDTIKLTAAGFLKTAMQGQKQRSFSFHPDRAALLVLDMQDYFLLPESHAFIPSAAAVFPNIKILVQGFTAANRPVIFTKHENEENNAGMMLHWWRELLTPTHPLGFIHRDFSPDPAQILRKTHYDAFLDTELKTVLDANDVEQVVITGVMTHLCCETTARSAFMQNYHVFFCVDGTATYNQIFHQNTLTNLAHGFANLVLSDTILNKMEVWT